jgi:hypothetical protein
MRSRVLLTSIIVFLTFCLLACSKQPADNATSSMDNTATTSSAPGEAAPANNPSEPAKARTERAKPEARSAVIPSGTVLTVRLGEAVGSKISQPGQSFSGTLAQPVAVGGRNVIPAGATVSGTVVDAKPLGRFKGGAVLELKLDSVNVHGTDRPVQTAAVTRTQSGKGKRTAVMAGGGAGLGALIGGLAGGGKGAAIGALAGAGAGGTGAAFTGNKEIVIPAESALSFTLSQPLEVR